MTPPLFSESFDPDQGPVGAIDEEEARRRDERREAYVAAWPDRALAVDRAGGTLVVHSLSGGRQRGYLAYALARKMRTWRLSYLYVEGARGSGMFVEVPLWDGRAKVVSAPFESPAELDPPPEPLRGFSPPTFGDWDGILALPVDPASWIELPEGFQPLG